MVQSRFTTRSQEELRPAGGPVIDPLKPKLAAVSFTPPCSKSIQRSIWLDRGLAITRPIASVEDSDIDARSKPCASSSVNGTKSTVPPHRVTVQPSLCGLDNGEEFDGGKADDFPLELGSGSMIPGFGTG